MPLCKIHGMRSLTFQWTPLDLRPVHLHAMITSWPNIVELRLGDVAHENTSADVPFEDILVIAQSCPKLESLFLKVGDPQSPDILAEAPPPSQHTSLTHLILGRSPITEVVPAAKFVARLFPRAVNGILWRGSENTDDLILWSETIAEAHGTRKLDSDPVYVADDDICSYHLPDDA